MKLFITTLFACIVCWSIPAQSQVKSKPLITTIQGADYISKGDQCQLMINTGPQVRELNVNDLKPLLEIPGALADLKANTPQMTPDVVKGFIRDNNGLEILGLNGKKGHPDCHALRRLADKLNDYYKNNPTQENFRESSMYILNRNHPDFRAKFPPEWNQQKTPTSPSKNPASTPGGTAQ